jgi:hypothetical protein
MFKRLAVPIAVLAVMSIVRPSFGQTAICGILTTAVIQGN